MGSISNDTKETEATSADRISSLPDEILHKILSFFEMKHAVQTSILSSRWRYLWTSNPNLIFPFELAPSVEEYVQIINGCLEKYKAETINRFLVDNGCLVSKIDVCDTESWIEFATTKEVRELILTVSTLPNFLFFHAPLTELVVTFATFIPPAEFKGFPSLKVLELCEVYISDSTVQIMLLKCPLLEKLIIKNCDWVVNLNIPASKSRLKSLEICWCVYLEELIVDAPNLVSLKCGGERSVDICLHNVPQLLKAEIFFIDGLHPLEVREQIPWLQCMAHVNSLTMGTWFTQFVFQQYWLMRTPHILFLKLKEFHWFGMLGSPEVLSLASFLGDCPFLQKLCLNIQYPREFYWYEHYRGFFRNKMHHLARLQFALPQLKTIEIVGFSGARKEIDMVRFLLYKAINLELLLLKSLPLYEEELSQLKAQIYHLPKTSTHAEIMITPSPPAPEPGREISGVVSSSSGIPSDLLTEHGWYEGFVNGAALESVVTSVLDD